MRIGVVFDLDGVLADSEGLQYRAYTAVLARYGAGVTPEEYATHWILAGRGPEYAVERFGLPLTPEELRALKTPVYRDILRGGVRPMPGAAAAVARLGARFPLAVATNSSAEEAAFILGELGLRPAFAAVIAREHYARAKPEPDCILAAAGALGIAPGACVVVEDSHRGILAAHRAGATVVAVPNDFTRGGDFRLAARVLPSLDALTVPLVEELMAGR